VGVNVNHPVRTQPDTERRVEDRVGWLEQVHVKADGMYGNLNVLKSHPMANPLFEAAERNPRILGLSHNAAGRERRTGNVNIVEEIKRVRSVDIVTAPATTKGLFESKETVMKLKESVKALDQKDKATKWLSELIEADPEMAEAPVEAGGEDAMKAAFRAAVVAVFDNDALDAKASMKKIGEVIKAYEKVTAAGEEKAPEEETKEEAGEEEKKPEEEAASKAAAESKDPEIERLKARDKARDLLEDAGIVPKDAKHREAMIESLAGATAENQAALIETWKVKKEEPASRPRSGGYFRESKTEKKAPKFASTYLS
jgi:hypothetical protein